MTGFAFPEVMAVIVDAVAVGAFGRAATVFDLWGAESPSNSIGGS